MAPLIDPAGAADSPAFADRSRFHDIFINRVGAAGEHATSDALIATTIDNYTVACAELWQSDGVPKIRLEHTT